MANAPSPAAPTTPPDNETDHLTAWEHGGTTGATNLAQLCPKHHRLKHHSQWTPEPATTKDPPAWTSPGWTSPTGRHYKPENPTPEPTHWPPGILPLEAVAGAISVAASRGSAGLDTGAPTIAAASLGAAAQSEATGSEEDEQWQRWQQLLADVPAWPDPPLEEPDDEDLPDPRGLSASDRLWDDFCALPFVLPPDPLKDCELLDSRS